MADSLGDHQDYSKPKAHYNWWDWLVWRDHHPTVDGDENPPPTKLQIEALVKFRMDRGIAVLFNKRQASLALDECIREAKEYRSLKERGRLAAEDKEPKEDQ